MRRQMITFLDGKLVNALPTQAIIDVGGVGYEVFIPLSSYDKLPAAGQPVRILTHLHVREDAQILYGFMTGAERDLFRLLVNNVSGIGPKLALAVLSGMSVERFKAAVASAEHAPTAEQSQANEAVLALIALGYKQVDAHKTVRDLQEREPDITTAQELVKSALKKMAAGR